MRGSRGFLLSLVCAALLAASGCASQTDPGAQAVPSGTDASSKTGTTGSSPGYNSTSTVELNVSIRDGKVSPRPRRVPVPLGAAVQLQVTSDVDDVIHVHGMQIEESVPAGQPTTITIPAEQPGLYEVETHESGLTLLQLEVR